MDGCHLLSLVTSHILALSPFNQVLLFEGLHYHPTVNPLLPLVCVEEEKSVLGRPGRTLNIIES